MNVPEKSLKRNKQKQTYHVVLFNHKTMRKQLWTTPRTFQLQGKKGIFTIKYICWKMQSQMLASTKFLEYD